MSGEQADVSGLVLVAEDSLVVRAVLGRQLEAYGYRVVQAVDGEDALLKAAEHRPDVILLDVEMPKLDGLAACRALRANPRQETVPIIMLTARSGEEQVLMGFAEGATDYLTKPFAVAQFRARVRAWLTQAAHE